MTACPAATALAAQRFAEADARYDAAARYAASVQPGSYAAWERVRCAKAEADAAREIYFRCVDTGRERDKC
jgi:hypothetical protein